VVQEPVAHGATNQGDSILSRSSQEHGPEGGWNAWQFQGDIPEDGGIISDKASKIYRGKPGGFSPTMEDDN